MVFKRYLLLAILENTWANEWKATDVYYFKFRILLSAGDIPYMHVHIYRRQFIVCLGNVLTIMSNVMKDILEQRAL